MKILRFCIPAVLALGIGPALAEGEEDAEFNSAVRQYGYTAGAAYQCAPEQEKEALDEKILRSFNGLSQLFGTDQAYYVAVSVGAGSATSVDQAECPKHLKDFEELTAAGVKGAGAQ